MPKQLVVITGLERGRVLPLEESDIIQLGCGQNLGVLARFRDAGVARVHCEILVEHGTVYVVDAETPFGTFLNGKRIKRSPLQPGDVIRIGETELRFLEGQDTAGTSVVAANDDTEREAPTVRSSILRAAGVELLGKLTGKVFTHFKVQYVVGTGRWGRVFHAEDLRGGRPVALKVLRPDFSGKEDSVRYLGRALKEVLPLVHDNLVAYHGAGVAGPLCWMAMEYVEGKSVTQLVRRLSNGAAPDLKSALRVAIHLCRGLDDVHRHGLVHGDVTPQNVLVREEDKATKLSDLMLARTLQGVFPAYSDRPLEPIEELAFRAPERATARGPVDARSDLYGLGAITYALLTGRPPFQGDTREELLELIEHTAPLRPTRLHPNLPHLVEGLVLKLLAKRPEDRFQRAADVLASLETIAKRSGVPL